MANALNSYLGNQNPAFLGPAGLKTVTQGPTLERYHDEEYHGWQKSKGSKKNNVALSALTLLAFLFFLNILQNCIQDHTDEMKGKNKGIYNVPLQQQQISVPIVVPTGTATGREQTNLKGEPGDLPVDKSKKIKSHKKLKKQNVETSTYNVETWHES